MINPILMMLAGQKPEMMGPLLDQLGAPPPNSPITQALFGGMGEDGGLGQMLMGGNAHPTTPGAYETPIPPMPSQPDLMGGPPPGLATPPNAGTAPPLPGGPNLETLARPPGARGQPMVRAPETPKPIMSGGIAGAQKAPEMALKAGGTSPAQALMQALLMSSGGGGDPLRVPSLGQLLRR